MTTFKKEEKAKFWYIYIDHGLHELVEYIFCVASMSSWDRWTSRLVIIEFYFAVEQSDGNFFCYKCNIYRDFVFSKMKEKFQLG